ncbi:hypothetical protein EW146_g2620 [Bondarzewia mesenterica]|uniref:Uncharacterized protein n=1 Tax=Bondarzewia mesenterica TaxID=1095465 RepID=A0A4S4M6C0_9AGAM|nr:hypothetical protein EW146_g2620 [Bondarzewia mesenterica]
MSAAIHSSISPFPIFATALGTVSLDLRAHARTAFLFTYSDIKTVVFPIVSHSPPSHSLARSLTHSIAPTGSLCVRRDGNFLYGLLSAHDFLDMAPPPAREHLQPKEQRGRRRAGQTVAPTPIAQDLRRRCVGAALGRVCALPRTRASHAYAAREPGTRARHRRPRRPPALGSLDFKELV